MNANLGWSTSDYLLNGVMDKHYSHNRSGTFELISHVSAHLAVDYRVTSGQSLGRLSMGKRTNTVYQTHYLNLTVTANGPHTFFVQNFLYHHNIPQQRDQYFIDLNYRYTMKKWKTDLVLTGTNLLNNKEYVQQFSNDIELVQSYFELRPRQFILSTTFRF